MNLKLKAALITAAIIVSGFGVGLLLSFLPNWASLVFLLAVACYVLYTVSLAELKYSKAVDEINQKYQK